jgi:hypothetical protein
MAMVEKYKNQIQGHFLKIKKKNLNVSKIFFKRIIFYFKLIYIYFFISFGRVNVKNKKYII